MQKLAQIQASMDVVEVATHNTRMRMRNARFTSSDKPALHRLKRESVVAGDDGGAVGDLPPASLFPATVAKLWEVGEGVGRGEWVVLVASFPCSPHALPKAPPPHIPVANCSLTMRS